MILSIVDLKYKFTSETKSKIEFEFRVEVGIVFEVVIIASPLKREF